MWIDCSAKMLVITDEKRPHAVAGVMGGEFSGVYDDTTTIVFEAPCSMVPLCAPLPKKLGMHRSVSRLL